MLKPGRCGPLRPCVPASPSPVFLRWTVTVTVAGVTVTVNVTVTVIPQSPRPRPCPENATAKYHDSPRHFPIRIAVKYPTPPPAAQSSMPRTRHPRQSGSMFWKEGNKERKKEALATVALVFAGWLAGLTPLDPGIRCQITSDKRQVPAPCQFYSWTLSQATSRRLIRYPTLQYS